MGRRDWIGFLRLVLGISSLPVLKLEIGTLVTFSQRWRRGSVGRDLDRPHPTVMQSPPAPGSPITASVAASVFRVRLKWAAQ